jgi:sulfate permease, SulP family
VASGILAFAPLGAEYAGAGAVAGIVSGIVGGLFAAMLRRSSFLTTGPTTLMALIQASFLGSLVYSVGDLQIALVALPVCAMLAGLWQIGFGLTGVSRLIKLTPYRVTAGFVSGIGLLIMLSQVPKLLGVDSLGSIFDGAELAPIHAGFGAVVVAVVAASRRLAPKVPALLAGLVFGFAGYHAAAFAFPGLDLGPMVGAVDLSSWRPFDPLDPAARSFASILGETWLLLLGASLTLALVGTLDITFALESARGIAGIRIDQKRDLIAQGASGIAAGATGGLFVSPSLTLTTANYRAGGRTRLSTIVVALILLLGILLVPALIFSLPLVALAALLVIIGFNVVDRWAVNVCRRALFGKDPDSRAQARRNAAIVVTVAGATLFGEPIVGAAVGFALACLVFLVEMSRPAVASLGTAEHLRSKRIRSVIHEQQLAEGCANVAVIRLQGLIFFGNADEIRSRVYELPEKVRTVIFDFRQVTEIDVSGALVMAQTCARLRRGEVTVLISSVRSPRVAAAVAREMSDTPVLAELDSALEKSEDLILAEKLPAGAAALEISLEESDFARSMNAGEAARLASHLRRIDYPRGSFVYRTGDPSDRFWILSRGSVSVLASTPEGEFRLADIGPGCTVGEMGVLNNATRSADVRADSDVVAYELTTETFAKILAEEPRLGHAILTSISRQLADRLRQTSGELRMVSE